MRAPRGPDGRPAGRRRPGRPRAGRCTTRDRLPPERARRLFAGINMTALQIIFWGCATLVLYAYMAYPVLIWGLSRAFGRLVPPPTVPDADLPAVSLLIAAFNEETVIADRIENALLSDYPGIKLEIVV